MTKKKPFEGFQPKNQPLSRQIADKIQQMVMDGELMPGDRLPSERQLAEQLNVSRNMIREAAALLEERGIVSVQTGSGIYITEASIDTVARTFSLYAQRKQVTVAQMFEVRWMLELENARLAATNALPKQIEQLAATLKEMEETKSNLEKFTKTDIRFHQQLAYASQNPLFPVLLDTITDLLHEQALLATAVDGALENALQHHRNILAAVQNKDAQTAREAMKTHLEDGWGFLLMAVKDPQETIGIMRFVVTQPNEE